MTNQSGPTKTATREINSLKFRLKLNGDIIVSRFGYPDDRATYPRWYFSSTIKEEGAERIKDQHSLSVDNREIIL